MQTQQSSSSQFSSWIFSRQKRPSRAADNTALAMQTWQALCSNPPHLPQRLFLHIHRVLGLGLLYILQLVVELDSLLPQLTWPWQPLMPHNALSLVTQTQGWPPCHIPDTAAGKAGTGLLSLPSVLRPPVWAQTRYFVLNIWTFQGQETAQTWLTIKRLRGPL